MNKREMLTTGFGAPVDNTSNSLTVGAKGPVLLEDVNFIEKIAHFDRERIPERVVHAKGTGAFGYFEPYRSMADYTCASFLQNPSKRTRILIRFSTVIGFRGSADTVRDPRGFAVRFYTDEGNYDVAGLSFPVFLKYTTCIMTDKVSNTGINAITSNNNGISRYNANPDITPPNIREPVSPIKTLAG